MSLATWKEEFYPIEASECKEEDALEHCLQKWIGLRKENINKHEVKVNHTGELHCKGYELIIDSSSCSLCQFYLHSDDHDDCIACPLYTANDDHDCTEDFDDRDESPFNAYCYNDDHDPEPMIQLIHKAIKQKDDSK